ncbi:trypco2 family protein [Streptomyces roseicoloratus]|uniref:trypco2 family protein n=1 Tax=Streptomyces roseicoloratus TaxID=2508722 RepID=UPI001CA583EE
MTDTTPKIELADAIASVRDQLLIAAGRATGQAVAFEVGDIEMEFSVELRKEGKAGGKIKAWVVEAGADASRSRGDTHRVSFTLKPRNAATGGAWLVGNEEEADLSGFGHGAAAEDPAAGTVGARGAERTARAARADNATGPERIARAARADNATEATEAAGAEAR